MESGPMTPEIPGPVSAVLTGPSSPL